jgi:hypothetical protein
MSIPYNKLFLSDPVEKKKYQTEIDMCINKQRQKRQADPADPRIKLLQNQFKRDISKLQ